MTDELLRFDRFEIGLAERALRVGGRPVEVGARAFDLLVALAQRRERIVSRQELLDLVWPGVVVEEHNITAQISSLRKLIGPDAIATIPGRGYRFTGVPEGTSTACPAPPVARAAARTRLPSQLTPLIGRTDDLPELAALVGRERLVTVVGAGGIGKTLLAQHVVVGAQNELPHGACWIELAGISDGAQLPLRIADALNVRLGADAPLAGLSASLASLSMLIALDNAEHLLADVGRTAAAMLDAAPGLRILVTSQAPLRATGERIFRVRPLGVPEGPLPAALALAFGAVTLFAERARRADARYVFTDADAMLAIELCRQLDGLPLAIELAAARAPLLGVRQLLASLQHRLQVLTRNPDAAAPARQQTLRAALEWSLSFLDEREATVFRRLGVFVDSAPLDLIRHVVADEQGPLDGWAVVDALGMLADRSIVAVFDHDGSTRYRLLESPRLVALERLDAAGERDQLQRRHARCVAAMFDAAREESFSGRVGFQALAHRLLADAGNARAAIAWARSANEPDTVVAVAVMLFSALPRWSHLERMELGDLCEALADRVVSPQLRLRALGTAIRPMFHASQEQSLAVAARALALARELDRDTDDRWPLYEALSEWICAAAVVTRPARDAVYAALDEMQLIEHPRWPPQRLMKGAGARRLARAAFVDAEQPAEQLELTRRWFAIAEAAGVDTTPAIGMLIDAELEAGHVDAGVHLGERMLERLGAGRDEWSRMMVRLNLANAYLLRDDTRRARTLLQAAWPVAVRFQMRAWATDAPALLAAIERRWRTAAVLAGYADAAFTARGLLRHPIEAASRERCGALTSAALGEVDFTRLHRIGQGLADEQFPSLAFASDDAWR